MSFPFTASDYDEFYRRTTEQWNAGARDWDVHESRAAASTFHFGVQDKNLDWCRSAIRRAMKHGLPLDDFAKRAE